MAGGERKNFRNRISLINLDNIGMPSTIEQTKEMILKRGGKASKHQIARGLKISLDYAGLILGDLKRKGEIAFSVGFETVE